MWTTFLATFSEQQLLVRPCIMGKLHLFKVMLTVPMKARTPDVLSCFRIGIHHAGAFHQMVPVVIPNHDFDVAQASGCQGWSQVIANKIAFFLTAHTGTPSFA